MKLAKDLRGLLQVMYHPTSSNRNALECAMNVYQRFEDSPLFSICASEDINDANSSEMVRALLFARASVCLAGGYGTRTFPLQEAVRRHKHKTLAILLSAGACVDNVAGSMLQTPLALANCMGGVGAFETVKRLVFSGADIVAVDDDHLIPIMRCILNQNLEALKFWSMLFKWVPATDNKITLPALLHYTDTNFGRLPSLVDCLHWCAAVDWVEGVEYLSPYVAEGQSKVFEILSTTIAATNGTAGNIFALVQKSSHKLLISVEKLWELACVKDDVGLAAVAAESGLRQEIPPLNVLESILKYYSWNMLLAQKITHGEALLALCECASDRFYFPPVQKSERWVLRPSNDYGWPVPHILEAVYLQHNLPLEYADCKAPAAALLNPELYPKMILDLLTFLAHRGCPFDGTAQALLAMLPRYSHTEASLISALFQGNQPLPALVKEVQSFRALNGDNILHVMVRSHEELVPQMVSAFPCLEAELNAEGLTARELATRLVVDYTEEARGFDSSEEYRVWHDETFSLAKYEVDPLVLDLVEHRRTAVLVATDWGYFKHLVNWRNQSQRDSDDEFDAEDEDNDDVLVVGF